MPISAIDDATRPRAKFQFPYYGLFLCVEGARAIEEKGGGQGTTPELTVWLGHKGGVTSGAFLGKLASMRLFGLVTNATDGVIATTDRAKQIVTPEYPEDARRA